MSDDDLKEVLSREFESRTATVDAAPGIADSAIQRGRAARRRRRAMSGALSTAVAVVAVSGGVTLLPRMSSGSDGNRVAATSTTATPATSPATQETQPPTPTTDLSYTPPIYVSGAGPEESPLVHAGGKTVALPPMWLVLKLIRAGEGLIADVSWVDERFAVYIAPSTGAVKRLSGINPPLAVSKQGTTVVGVLNNEESLNQGLVAVALPSGRVVASTKNISGGTPILVQDDGTTLVTQDDLDPIGGTPARVLQWTPADGALTPVPGLASGETVTGIASDGSYVIFSAQGERISVLDRDNGARKWSRAVIGGAGKLSPDGRVLALRENRRVVFIEAATGEERRATADFPFTPYGSTWEDGDKVLVNDPMAVAGGVRFRCSVSTGDCQQVKEPAGGIYAVAEQP